MASWWPVFITLASLTEGVTPSFTRCRSDRDCPVGGLCFKDECPHCLCPRGHVVTNYVRDLRVIRICAKESSALVGDPCPRPPHFCPDGSHCDDVTGTCQCHRHLVMDRSLSFCRAAIIGELCSTQTPCTQSLGLTCTESPRQPASCQCVTSLRPPDAWARHVINKWRFDRVDAIVQQCVIRSVGEHCTSDDHCASVGGSGAMCAPCRLCQCKRVGHVPTLLGDRCGPPLLLGDRCSHVMASVCDGTQGLQCGHRCDFYKEDLERLQTCGCSQMHQLERGVCKPKRKGKKCSTDLDCYLLRGGYGVCENKRCTLTGNNTSFHPHRVNRKCHKVKSDNTVIRMTSQSHRQQERLSPIAITKSQISSEVTFIPKSEHLMTASPPVHNVTVFSPNLRDKTGASEVDYNRPTLSHHHTENTGPSSEVDYNRPTLSLHHTENTGPSSEVDYNRPTLSHHHTENTGPSSEVDYNRPTLSHHHTENTGPSSEVHFDVTVLSHHHSDNTRPSSEVVFVDGLYWETNSSNAEDISPGHYSSGAAGTRVWTLGRLVYCRLLAISLLWTL